MTLRVLDLRPYKSFILARVREDAELKTIDASVLDDLAALLKLDPAGARNLVTRQDPIAVGELDVGFLHYVEDQKVSWAEDSSGLSDRFHHLVLVCRRSRHVALLLSDPSCQPAVRRRFRRGVARGLGALEPIPRGILNAAFVKGEARTLWLSGTHARTSVKADSKILSGIDLRDALDPLGDQTYAFTAARALSTMAGLRIPVGVSPQRSGVWLGATKNWEDFAEMTITLLRHLEAVTQPEESPLPVLAVAGAGTAAVAGAFDMAILPAEFLADDPSLDVEAREEMELWADRASFSIVEASGANLNAEVRLDGKLLGSIDLAVDPSDPDHVVLAVTGEPASQEGQDKHRKALQACRRPQWLKVWYESGHTLSDGRLYLVRHRDLPFTGFMWANFNGFDVYREKPTPLDTIGKQDSLFCWTMLHWPSMDGSPSKGRGWLACDDGAMEIADFIHLDDRSAPPVLSLIHVKKAVKSGVSGVRGIRVSAFEEVVGQAVKNLRHLTGSFWRKDSMQGSRGRSENSSGTTGSREIAGA